MADSLMKDLFRLDSGLFLLRLDPHGDKHQYDSLRAACSNFRQERADRYLKHDDRLRCLAAGWLVSHAVERLMGLPGINEEHDALGKPFLPRFPDTTVSISHSGCWVACALRTGGSMGIDVEMPPHIAPGMAELFMSEEELYTYRRSPSSDERRRFFHRIWCLKESWLKAVGTGMGQDPTKVTILPDGGVMLVRGRKNDSWHIHEKWLDDGALLTLCWR